MINSKQLKGVHNPKTNLGQAKMDTIASTAEELFTTVGFYETSVSDVCKKAKTAVGTFYIYFESKTAVYRYLIEKYKKDIKQALTNSIANCKTRAEKEREGIKCFISYALKKPTVYNLIWGSLSIDEQLFVDYYESFAYSYAKSLSCDEKEILHKDTTTVAYMLMGITNFVGLRAIFKKMTDEDVDKLMEETVMPMLQHGLFK